MRWTRLVPPLVLALGLLTTVALYASVVSAGNQRHQEEIRREIDRLRSAANEAFRRQVSVLNAFSGALSANPNLGQVQLQRFDAQVGTDQDAGTPDTIELVRLQPKTAEGEPRVVLIRASLVTGDQGTQPFRSPLRARAMDLARERKRAVATGPVDLSGHPGFVVCLPMTTPPGFVVSELRADRLFGPLFQSIEGDHIGLRLTSDDKARKIIYKHTLIERVGKPIPFDIALPSVGTSLKAEMTVSSEFGFPSVVRPWILPFGTVVSLLLFLLALNLGNAHEEAQRREAEQGILAEIGRLTAGTAELDDEALKKIAAATARFFDAVCRIDLIEPMFVLRTISTRTGGMEAIAELEREYPRERCDPLFRRALETGRPQRAPGYETLDERHRDLVEALRAGPILIVPLRIGNRALGALSYVRQLGKPGFSADAATLAETIAGRVALALDNARLYHDLERRVEERTRDLEASNQELESFCYSVSHDLRTPLRSLDGFGRLLKEDYGNRLDEGGVDYLNRILAAAKRMDELITALLTLSRLTRREIVPTEVDVSAMVEDQLHDLDPDRRIQTSVQPGLRVHADARMLAVMLDNLLVNAVKFSSRTDSPAIQVGLAEDGSLFVKDNGAGFDMAYAAKLFQPFERLHSPREFPGHGIGLATVERIVRRHGGEVRAEGKPGEGATFYVSFPT